MAFLGDYCTAEFARPRGAKDKRPRRRRYGEAAAATTAIGGGGYAGAKGANRIADAGYRYAVDESYKQARNSRRIFRVLPEKLSPKLRNRVARIGRSFAQKAAPMAVKIPDVKASRSARLGLAIIAKPGRAGAVGGAVAGAGLYGGYRATRYGVYKARGGNRRRGR